MKEYKFPTVHREAGFTEEGVPFAGDRYVVGEKALKHKRGCRYIRTISELVELYPLYLGEVQQREGNLGKVAVSLPLDAYAVEKRKRELNIDNLLDRLVLNCSKHGFDTSVVPQGIAGLQHLLSTGQVSQKQTLLIDGGFNTVNTAVVNPELEVEFFKTFTDEIGVRNLIEDFFADELRKRYSAVSTNLVVLKEVFLQGKLDSGLSIEDVQAEKDKALDRYKHKLVSVITGELERAGIDYGQIVVVGGLAYYLDMNFRTNKELHIPKDKPEFMNVRGLLDFAEDAQTAVDLGFGDCKVRLR